MGLRATVEDVNVYVEMGLEKLSAGSPLDRIGPTCDDLCQNYRTLAACALMLSADTDGFRHMLHRSGQVRLHFLERCAELSGYHDPYSATGNSAGFFDAVAAGDRPLAERIVAMSPERWREGEEYPDDFCYAYFCHLAIQGAAAPRLRMEETIRQFETALGKEKSARLAVCKSILEMSQASFDESFEALLVTRKAEVEEERPQFFPDDRIIFRTKSRIFVEGLAVLNIADLRGLSTAKEYRYCPITARLPMTSPFPADSRIAWQRPDR